ncbi:hypothetical protein Y032_0015g2726 [Ancylostoma ceylanicum]|uniref:Uncharacterized protein n=1 Tax=Ancylostoma ceylanicum TaxID=53326 RepID=A0A016V839_9BILA|nr:hypothetical protein Y032_0015g2726 [Ancylostoma ceylanicum]
MYRGDHKVAALTEVERGASGRSSHPHRTWVKVMMRRNLKVHSMGCCWQRKITTNSDGTATNKSAFELGKNERSEKIVWKPVRATTVHV